MTFPTIPTTGAGRVLWTLATAPSGTHTSPNLSSLTKNAGDLLIAGVIIYDGNSTNAEFSSWGGSFTEFKDQAGTATMGIGLAYKWSTGSETGTFTVTSADATTNDSAFFLLSIPGAHPSTPPEAGTMVTGTAPDVASFDPTWGTEDTLWIAVAGSGETATTGSYTGITTPPTNYTSESQSGISADVVGGVEGSVAFRQLNAASEDPGAWAMDTSNARGAAILIAVRPSLLQTVAPDFINQTATISAPTVIQQQFYTPALIDQTATIADPTLIQQQFYTPALIDQTGVIFAADITQGAGPAQTTYEEVVLADSPLAWWRLGEPSGAIANDEIGTADADYTNTPTLGVAGLLANDASTAVGFSRASLEYAVADGNMPAGASAGVSIEAWGTFADVAAATRYPTMRWFHTTPVADTRIYYDVDAGAWRYFYQDATTLRNVFSDAWTPTVGPTYHMVVVHDYSAETVKFYVNGTLISTEDVSANDAPIVHASSGFASIGRSASDYWNGTLDEVAIYNSVLSPTRILAHYAMGVDNGYVSAVVADSPIGYWRMGEVSGTVLDSVGTNNGTAAGTLTRDVTGALSVADDDGAISFTDGEVAIGDVLDITVGSYELWFKRSNTASAYQRLIGKSLGQPNIDIATDHYVKVGEENVYFCTSFPLTLDNTDWHHLVYTNPGGSSFGNLYIDGEDVTTNESVATLTVNATSLHIGRSATDVVPFVGVIDEVAIYNTVLSPTRVLAHYTAGFSVVEQPAVGQRRHYHQLLAH